MKYTKREVNILDHATEVLKALRSGGLLVNTKHDGFVNTMTVSWGQIGYEWEKPMMTVFIRKHRCTHDQLEAHGEFTVSVPMGNFDRKILGIAGTKSGHDVDKIKERGLTPVDSNHVDVPGFAELPLTIECKVKYVQDQIRRLLPTNSRPTCTRRTRMGHFTGRTAITTPFTWVKSWART